jgi:histidine triad (HIT) family protein
MEESVFTKIIKGEIPCHKVYEDETVIAFLDIAPYTYGHTLVIPKEQTDHLWDVDDELYRNLMDVVKKIAVRQKEVINPPRVGFALEGFAVPHAHVHVFPLYKGLEETMNEIVDKPSDEELAEMAKKLKF